MQYYADGVKLGGCVAFSGREQSGFESGIRAGVTGMLASPFFLYRGERVPAGLKPGEKYAITRSRTCVEAFVLPVELDSRR